MAEEDIKITPDDDEKKPSIGEPAAKKKKRRRPRRKKKKPRPEEPSTEEPSSFILEEEPEGPVGWDALKKEIKKDYKKTEEEMAKPPEEETPPPEPATETPPPPPIPEEKAKEEEVVEVEPVEPVKPAEVAKPEEEERKEVIRIITKYVIGGCIVILIITGIFFFQLPQSVYNFAKDLIFGEPTVQVSEEEAGEMVMVSENLAPSVETSFLIGKNRGTSIERFESGVQTTLITGERLPEERRISPSIEATFSTGLPEKPETEGDRLASYMQVLVRLQNAFVTDIHQMLDFSDDRSQALEEHIRELNNLQDEATQTLAQINTEKDDLKIKFNEATTEKEQYEKDFFVAMEKLEANKANNLLNAFIDASQRQIELKSEYNGLNKASLLFRTAIDNMEARIKDIELNREALVKGVKVVDIKGSDLELIIHEEEVE